MLSGYWNSSELNSDGESLIFESKKLINVCQFISEGSIFAKKAGEFSGNVQKSKKK